MFKKGIGVIVPLFDVTLCLLMLQSLRIPYFPFLLLLLVKGEDDDLLVYTIALPAPSAPILTLVLVNLPLLRYILGARTLQSLV